MYCQPSLPTPSGRCLVKLALLLVFCCFAESAAGSCIRYGHSCWGAHGKRAHRENAPKNDALLDADARWFIARLLQTNDNRPLEGLKERANAKTADEVSISEANHKTADFYGTNDVTDEKLKLLEYLKNMEDERRTT